MEGTNIQSKVCTITVCGENAQPSAWVELTGNKACECGDTHGTPRKMARERLIASSSPSGIVYLAIMQIGKSLADEVVLTLDRVDSKSAVPHAVDYQESPARFGLISEMRVTLGSMDTGTTLRVPLFRYVELYDELSEKSDDLLYLDTLGYGSYFIPKFLTFKDSLSDAEVRHDIRSMLKDEIILPAGVEGKG